MAEERSEIFANEKILWHTGEAAGLRSTFKHWAGEKKYRLHCSRMRPRVDCQDEDERGRWRMVASQHSTRLMFEERASAAW